jgi:predicted 2-oxoglutarate/Fe(II)-dependent dioxygenase YbiX
MKINILAPCIMEIENALPNIEDVFTLIDNNSEWKQSGTFIEEFSEKRTSYSVNLKKAAESGDPLSKIVFNQIYHSIENSIKEYKNIFSFEEDLWHEPYTLLKYESGQGYDSHYDGNTKTARALSVLIYLNDDYLGGEIEFNYFNIKVKPKSNSLLIFPSNFAYTHTAHEVIDKTKYVIVTWLNDWLSEDLPQMPIKKSLKNIGLVKPID